MGSEATIKVEVLILGGGPSGATAALRLLEKGITPLIVERAEFPRYHIGESMTGECGAIVRELGFEEQMKAAGHPVKHGVRVAGPKGAQDWWIPVMKRTEQGLEKQSTWQVTRSKFDTMLLEAAIERGAKHIHGRAAEPILDEDGVLKGVLIAPHDGGEIRVEAELTFDCTGLASFLASRGVTGPKYRGSYDKQIAIFSQVSDYQRDHGPADEAEHQPGNTHIYYTSKYHWAWSIPIDEEATSVGIVIPSQYFVDKGESRDDFVRRELRELNPGLAARVPEARLLEPARAIPNYSFQVRKFAGPGYICIGDAHRFVDPIFSFGLYVAMKEAGMAADAAERYLQGEGRDCANPFGEYMVHAEMAIDALEDMIDFFWENPFAFSYLVHGRYREAFIDMFAGRIYDHAAMYDHRGDALTSFRSVLKRERLYDDSDIYSIPIGSRYHPERAPLWNTGLESVAATEGWIREAV